jgi:hypothetical protein
VKAWLSVQDCQQQGCPDITVAESLGHESGHAALLALTAERLGSTTVGAFCGIA